MKKSLLGMALVLTTQAQTADSVQLPGQLASTHLYTLETKDSAPHKTPGTVAAQPIPIQQQIHYQTHPLSPSTHNSASYPGTSSLKEIHPQKRSRLYSSHDIIEPTAPTRTDFSSPGSFEQHPYSHGPSSQHEWEQYQTFKRQQEEVRAREESQRNTKELEAFELLKKARSTHELQTASGRISPTGSVPPHYNTLDTQISPTDKTLPFVSAAINEGSTANENLSKVMQSFVTAVKGLAIKRDTYQAPATDSPKSRSRLGSIKSKGTSVEAMMKTAKKEQKGKDSYLRKEASGIQRILATLMICNKTLEDCKRKTNAELFREAGMDSEA